MLHIIPCPMCQRQFECPPEWAGKHVQCPACGNRFVAGAAGGPTLPSIPILREVPGYAAKPMAVPPMHSPASQPWHAPGYSPPPSSGTGRSGTGKRAALWIGIVLVVVVLIGIGMSMFSDTRVRPPAQRPLEREAPARGAAKVKPVPVPAADMPLADARTTAEVKGMMERFFDACAQHDEPAMRRHYDPQRLTERVEEHGGRALGRMREYVDLFEQDHDFLLGGSEFTIASVRDLGDDEVMLYSRLTNVKGHYSLRFWLTKRSGEWRIFDSEGLTDFIPSSLFVKFACDLPGARSKGSRDIESLRQAGEKLADGKMRDADQILRGLDEERLHPSLRASYRIVRGRIALGEHRFNEARDEWELAFQHDASAPLDYFRGMALNRLNQPKQALAFLERYRSLMGEGDEVCHEVGYALEQMQRFPEAAAQFRKSLDFEPKNNRFALLGLIRCLGPQDPREEVGVRFAKLNQRAESYKLLTDDCLQAKDGLSLEPIALVLLSADRSHADAMFHLSLAKVWTGKGKDGVQRFDELLRRWPQHAERGPRIEQFLKALVDSNQAQHAYPTLEEFPEVFPVIAGNLLKSFRTEDLKRVVRAHEAKFPADPRLPMFKAAVLVSDEKFAEADKLFESAKKKTDAETLNHARGSRVAARFHSGNAVAALRDIPPERDTFVQLVALCQQKSDDKLLGQLLDAYAERNRDAVELWQNRIRIKVRAKAFTEAAALFKDTWERLNNQWIPNERKQFVEDFLMDMVDAHRPLEAYQAAPDPKDAFRFLCQDMNVAGHRKELNELLKLHRKSQPGDPWGYLLRGRLHVADKAWDKASEDLDKARRLLPAPDNDNAKRELVFARYKAGQCLEAYREVGPSEDVFIQLAVNCMQDKNWGDLDTLIKAHRPLALADSQLPVYEARMLIAKKRADEGVAIFTRWAERQAVPGGQDHLLYTFVQDLEQGGVGMEGYRLLPNKEKVFEELARTWNFKKDVPKLSALLDEHAKNRPNDPKLLLYRGELHFLKGDYAEAEKTFAMALGRAPANANFFEKNRLQATRVKLGKAVREFREQGLDSTVFESLCQSCVNEKDHDQLEALIAERRKTEPEDGHLPAWEIEARWLKKDYKGIVEQLRGEGKKHLESPRYRWKFENHFVRALVKLDRADEAIGEAERLNTGKAFTPFWLILAYASKGDVAKTIELLDKNRHDDLFAADCYRDPDLGPILRSPPFKPFRDKFPEPPENVIAP